MGFIPRQLTVFLTIVDNLAFINCAFCFISFFDKQTAFNSNSVEGLNNSTAYKLFDVHYSMSLFINFACVQCY